MVKSSKSAMQFSKVISKSGNLNNVEQIGSSTYLMTLQNQVNSCRKSIWFYFLCQGLKGQTTFVIKGFTKSSSLYNNGMKICYRENKDKIKWRRGGTKISYSSYYDGEEETNQYQLKFSYFFKTNEPCGVEFAYCFPYTYKRLFSLIKNILVSVQYSSLGRSFDGREIPLLTIGNRDSKQAMVFSARVHPGQTVGSFIMQGFIKQLLNTSSQYAKYLRDNYLIKIVPMINPDGVVRGNYRFSTAGFDLNRKWKKCKESTQPQIFYLKNMIISLNKQKKVVMYVDIHGHSRKKNAFFYGCCNTVNGITNHKPKEFPYLMNKLYDAFKYQFCSYAIQKDKEGTARICMWKQLQIDYVYTLQSTFCGALNWRKLFRG